MKSITVLTLALGLGLALPASPDAHAGFGGIQRCRAPDGTAVYTDKPCLAFNAKPEAMSSELGMRLASEASREPVIRDNVAADAMIPTGTASRRSLLAGCAQSPTQLAMDLQGSIALHDVNRLAESWHWVGITQKQATPLMKRLEALAKAEGASARYYDAQIGFSTQVASAGDGYPDDGGAGILQLALAGDGAQSLELNVERYAGCYFVRF
ncbi:hypothetical protein [Lysobacter xanthus]